MTDDWTKDFFTRFGANTIWVKPSRENVETILEIHAFVAEQRERAREEAVEYIKLHSPKLHATGGYEVKNEILDEATREGE